MGTHDNRQTPFSRTLQIVQCGHAEQKMTKCCTDENLSHFVVLFLQYNTEYTKCCPDEHSSHFAVICLTSRREKQQRSDEQLFERLASLDIMESPPPPPCIHLDLQSTVVLKGLREALNLASNMQRDVRLSDSCISDHCYFQSGLLRVYIYIYIIYINTQTHI